MDIRVYGHLRAAFGLAGGAQATCRALRAAGCRVWPVDLPLPTHPPLDDPVAPWAESPHQQGSVQVDLVHTNPNILAQLPVLLNTDALTAPIRIGYWAWELEQFPEGWQQQFRGYDEIWCPSSFTAQSLAQRAPLPVVALPHLPNWPLLEALRRRRLVARSGQPAGESVFRFLTLFDYWSTPERKNPAGVIAAFQRAFPLGRRGDPSVELLIKTSSAEQFAPQAARLRALAGADPRIHWIEGLLSPEQFEQLWLSADALVSLHRAEGFGLVMAEAMALGVPVIATGYSGNLEFCVPGSAALIPWQPVPLPATVGDYPAGATWAEPDADAAAAAMAQLAADPEAAVALGSRGRQAVLERLAPQRLAGIIRQRLGTHLLPPDPGPAAAGPGPAPRPLARLNC